MIRRFLTVTESPRYLNGLSPRILYRTAVPDYAHRLHCPAANHSAKSVQDPSSFKVSIENLSSPGLISSVLSMFEQAYTGMWSAF